MRKSIGWLVVPAALLMAPAAAHAQLGLGIEPYVGAAIPTGDFADGASTGFSVGARVLGGLVPGFVSWYGGLDYQSFGVEDDEEIGEDVDADITDLVGRVGAQFNIPLAGTLTGVSPFVEGGAVFGRATIGASSGDVSVDFDSDWGFGFEAGAGLRIPVAPRMDASIVGRYRSYSAEFDIDEEDPDFTGGELDVTYFAITAGLNIRL